MEVKQRAFFASCKRLKPAERNEQYERIRREYAKVVEDSSEKIQNAEDCYNLVDRYLRKLDQELHKFKLELEADNRGITEILEKRSLEMDAPATNAAKENRLPKKHVRTTFPGVFRFDQNGIGISGEEEPNNCPRQLVLGLVIIIPDPGYHFG